MLAQLIYVSDRKSDCTEKEMAKILEACQKNNPPKGITGVLFYNEKKFLQLVEGEYKTIMEMYDKIKMDSRHEKCVLLSCLMIKEKSFPSWNMGLKKVDNTLEIHTEISKEDKVFLERLFLGSEEKDGTRISELIKRIFNN